MKKVLLQIWRLLPPWLEQIASLIVRPRYWVGVGAIIFNEEGQLLLGKHTYQRLHPWGIPGGDLKPGEDPAEAVRRELWEETGLSAKETKLVLVDNASELRSVSLIYLCTGVSGSFVPNEEVSEIQYFDLASLPTLTLGQQRILSKVLKSLPRKERGAGGLD